VGENRLQKAVNQRQLSDGLFLLLFGTVTALVLVTTEIAMLLKHVVTSAFKRIRSVL